MCSVPSRAVNLVECPLCPPPPRSYFHLEPSISPSCHPPSLRNQHQAKDHIHSLNHSLIHSPIHSFHRPLLPLYNQHYSAFAPTANLPSIPPSLFRAMVSPWKKQPEEVVDIVLKRAEVSKVCPNRYPLYTLNTFPLTHRSIDRPPFAEPSRPRPIQSQAWLGGPLP